MGDGGERERQKVAAEGEPCEIREETASGRGVMNGRSSLPQKKKGSPAVVQCCH